MVLFLGADNESQKWKDVTTLMLGIPPFQRLFIMVN